MVAVDTGSWLMILSTVGMLVTRHMRGMFSNWSYLSSVLSCLMFHSSPINIDHFFFIDLQH